MAKHCVLSGVTHTLVHFRRSVSQEGAPASGSAGRLHGYETDYFKFITKHWPNTFPSFTAYDSAVKLYHRLQKWSMFEAFHEYTELHC
eukprot:594547-Alexandrium_andersonii.AAC.1